ncbi:DUF4030 domain-containing protein [Virgibacillus necropolis]|uniref:DUF4179 domain-containing protein n=1 Tax=Virgibacillus necropolis TaxID=163877 RepID=A0A221MAZ0_9BACI|nr:DUF4030 domain-containing protein [Virgibacillus necropolis]ASN04782.1 hypothetical protein CFK40_07015 [Virgibacillus necropolis]
MNNKIKQELEKIEIPDELHNRAKLGVEKAKMEKEGHNSTGKKKKKWSIGKKFTYFGSAAVLLFGLLFGSAFIFPSMASVLAKVPFLSTIFESEPAVSTVSEELRDKGYKISGVSFRVKNKTMTISVDGSDEYYEDVKDEIKDIAKDILQSKHYDAYNLKVDKYKPFVPDVSEETKKRMEESDILLTAIRQSLEKHDYKVLSYGIRNNKFEEFITLDIPDTESRVEEIKELIHQVVQEKDLGEFPIKVNEINMERRAQESRWMPVINTIFEGLLAKEEYKVIGEGYSFYPLPLRIEIRTSIHSTDSDAQELGNKIEDTIDNFIETEAASKAVQGDPYRVEVLSKDKKKIN